MGLIISEPITYAPDLASSENSFTNKSYTYQAGTCTACGLSWRVERVSSEFHQAEAEAEVEIRSLFEAHKADCKLTKYRELYKEAGTATKKIAVIAEMLKLVEG